MANNRIINDGIITPKIYLGNQVNHGTFSYDAVSDTISINANLNILGGATQIESTNASFADNILVLNANDTGSSVSSGSSGLNVFRGTGQSVSLTYVESDQAWVLQNINGIGVRLKSNISPTQNDDLANKRYVDSTVTTSIGAVSLSSLYDTSILSPTNGQFLVFDGTRWANLSTSTGIKSVSLSGFGGIAINGSTSSTISNTTSTLNIDLAASGVSPGTYQNAIVTVNNRGIITSIAQQNLFQIFTTNTGANTYPLGPTDNLSILGINGITTSTNGSRILNISTTATGITPGSYNSPTMTVDAQGRITSIVSGGSTGWSSILPDTGGVINATGVGSQLRVEGGYGLSTSNNGTNTLNITVDRNIISAGTYTVPNITVDDAGRIVGISSNNVLSAINTNSGTATASGVSGLSLLGGIGGISTQVAGNIASINNSGGISGQLLSGNGYIKFASGMMIQWGRDSTVTDQVGTTFTTSFPISFGSGGPWSIDTTRYDPGGGTYNQKHHILLNRSMTSGFTWRIQDDDSGDGGSYVYGFDWIAIGPSPVLSSSSGSSATSIMTVGPWPYNNSSYWFYGYDGLISIGALTNTTLLGFTVSGIAMESYTPSLGYSNSLVFSVSGTLPNSGWTTFTVGSHSYNRVDAGFSQNGTDTSWYWTIPSGIDPIGTTVGAQVNISLS